MQTPNWEEIGALLAVVGEECWRGDLMPGVLMGEDRDGLNDDKLVAQLGYRGIDEARALELLDLSLVKIAEMGVTP